MAEPNLQLVENLGPKSDRDVEIDRLSAFPDIPDQPDLEDEAQGVLLSERIARFYHKYKMIYPFTPDKLKAASYELSVGDWYGMRGRSFRLEPGKNFTLDPFEVAIIQTLETLNLPRFLIARWNLRIAWVYKGLLWVGAPQVDPGFRGFLCFPLYNLSNQPRSIQHGQPIAAIDFEMTTPVSPNSMRYPWASRTRMVFSDYEKDQLESALVTEASNKIKQFEQTTKDIENQVREARSRLQQVQGDVANQLNSVQTRVDNYTILTFTIIAVLFAALGLALSRSPETSFWSSSALIAGIALWFALRSFYLARSSLARSPGLMWLEIVVGLALTGGLLVMQYRASEGVNADLIRVSDAASQLRKDVDDVKRDSELRKDVERRIDTLQREIDELRPKKH